MNPINKTDHMLQQLEFRLFRRAQQAVELVQQCIDTRFMHWEKKARYKYMIDEPETPQRLLTYTDYVNSLTSLPGVNSVSIRQQGHMLIDIDIHLKPLKYSVMKYQTLLDVQNMLYNNSIITLFFRLKFTSTQSLVI